MQWKGSKFEFNCESLEKSTFNLVDVFYIMRLCSYENELALKFKMGNSNNRVFKKENFKKGDQANLNGGLWIGDFENGGEGF